MEILRQIADREVWEHWRQVEQHPSLTFRTDIRNHLPTNILWYLCKFEEKDVEQLFIISSDDWADISGGSFKVVDVARRLTDLRSPNKDTQRIACDIEKKITTIRSGQQLDTRLIVITDSPSLYGPFTLIEGNKRAVAFVRLNSLVGSTFFVGYSPCVSDYAVTRYTYQSFLSKCRP